MRPFEELAAEARDAKALTFARKSAIHELAKSGDERALDVLDELGGDAEASIRREAIAALGGIEGPRATELLVRALDDKDRQCVKAALAQLGRRRDAAAVPALERLKETGDLSVRIEAERLLKQFGAGEEPVEEAEAPPEREPPARRPPEPAVPLPPPPVAERPPKPPARPEPPVTPVAVEEAPGRAVPEVPVAPRAVREPERTRMPPPPPPPFAPTRTSGTPFPSPPPPHIPRSRLSGREYERLTPPDGAHRAFGAMDKAQSKPQGCGSPVAAVFVLIVLFIGFLILIGTCSSMR